MILEFHELVASDIIQIEDYYRTVGGETLARDFHDELFSYFLKAANSPRIYKKRSHNLRRVDLQRFPYHFLFRLHVKTVRILVVRHHKRRQSLGAGRR